MGLDLTFDGPTDLDGVFAEMLAILLADQPDLDPAELDIEIGLLKGAALSGSIVRTLLVGRVLADYRRFGLVQHDIAAHQAVAASAETTWTLRDTGGPITIPAGTRLAWPSAAGDVAFLLTAPINVTAGVTSITNVTLTAVDPGTGPHTLAPSPLRLTQPLGVVLTVTATSSPAGGADAETAGEYEDRITDRFGLFGETLIVPTDYAKAARDQPGVGRALALDGYDPVTDTWNNARTVTVALADNDGRVLPASIRDGVAAAISDPGWRAANTVTATIDPTYTQIIIDATVAVAAGADGPATKATAAQRVYDYLSPAVFPWGGTVERDEIFYIVRDTPNVIDVPILTLNGGTADVALAGVAPLPAPADDPTAPTTVTVQ